MKCLGGCGRNVHGRRRRCAECLGTPPSPSRQPYTIFENVAADARAKRIAEVMRREPELEPWQLMERFNLNENELAVMRVRIRRGGYA